MSKSAEHKSEFLKEVVKTITIRNSISKQDFALLKAKFDENTNNIGLISKFSQNKELAESSFDQIIVNIQEAVKNVEQLQNQLKTTEENLADFKHRLESTLELYHNFK
jgi:type I site-specific restriction endonuclease